MCSYSSEPETTAHFLLRCQRHVMNRSKRIKNVYNLDHTLRNYDWGHLIHRLLYGSEKLNFNLNKEIIKLTICYLWKIKNYFFLFVIIIIIIIVFILLHRDVDF